MRKKVEVILDIATSILVFALLTTAFHEFVHANVTRALGGSAYVVFQWTSGYCVPSGVAGMSLVAVGFSGGLGVALLYLYFERWWLSDPGDKNVRMVCRFYMLGQFLYALGEGTYFLDWHSNLVAWSAVSQIIAVMILAAWYLWWRNNSSKS